MCDRYCKVRRKLLQDGSGTAECDKRLLQSVTIIIKIEVTINIVTKTCCSEITTFTFLSKKKLFWEIIWRLYPQKIKDHRGSSRPGLFYRIDVLKIQTFKFNVYWKNTKLSSPWISKILKRYKRNTIIGNLHLSKKIPSNLGEEWRLIVKADYPMRFIYSVVSEFQKGKKCGDESFKIIIIS